jgi:nucleoside-diphosphate-sugar epimerase
MIHVSSLLPSPISHSQFYLTQLKQKLKFCVFNDKTIVQTILGTGGAIGIPLALQLKNYTDNIRLVSRNPEKVNVTDILVKADFMDVTQVDKAIAGSDIVYVTIGFEYKLKVWQNIWPPFMKEVIDSCISHSAKLVFFDNVYVYSKSSIPFMTEDSPIDPPSEKGKVRKQLHEMIMDSVEKRNLTALIARAADFYGPENKNSALTIMVAENLKNGKKAQVFGDPDRIHTYTFTPDAAKATAILGNAPDAYNQIWHVPTTKELLTNRNWIELIARELNKQPGIKIVPPFLIHLLGVFVPVMREFPEMLYQYEQDYILDSSKFEKRFGISAISPREGIRNMFKGAKT